MSGETAFLIISARCAIYLLLSSLSQTPGYVKIDFGYTVCQPLEDPRKTTDVILEALKDTGQRGILDRGWGGLGNGKWFTSCLSFHNPV